MARIVPALSAALGTELPGCRRALRRRRPGRLGPRQYGVVRVADRQARARPARPGRAGRWRAHGRRDGARQPLDHHPPARACCSGSWASVFSASTTSRSCPPRRRPAACSSSRRTSARPRRRLGVPLESFRTWIALHETTHAFEFEAHPWLRPYLASRLERQLTLFGQRRARAWAGGDPRARSRAPRRGWRRALDGAPDGRRAAAPCSARRRP